MLIVMLLLVYALLLLLLTCLWIKFGGKSTLKAPGNVLLIIAHPDDECMFFSPTILHLTRTAPQNMYLLCLSEGELLLLHTEACDTRVTLTVALVLIRTALPFQDQTIRLQFILSDLSVVCAKVISTERALLGSMNSTRVQ